ncbi:hypothetical protein BU14_0258s0033 [Porphyra umbilicalis]|uniref:Importin N-terminal domain-containing protein n=1 Tax=Porphyra umbilicalis TaxID=2786 RepID=A0A1X6P2F0_PORUM|nr:hypothetical protein BU14_0258s0033 [Porphyra umbilicalis]|eukprot:OSX75028.1 hypothetical protein BU14_0258s0033 [Porphyra umbilicalis]
MALPGDAALATLIDATLSPHAPDRRGAEAKLTDAEASPGFAVALLRLVVAGAATATDAGADARRQAAAVYLKNVTKRRWADLPAADTTAVRGALVEVLLGARPPVRRVLSEALAVIAEADFPDRWPSLLPTLAGRLVAAAPSAAARVAAAASPPGGGVSAATVVAGSPGGPIDWGGLDGALDALAAVFDRYRDRFRSDALFTEINYALGVVQAPLLGVFEAVAGALLAPAGGGGGGGAAPAPAADAPESHVRVAAAVVRVFHSLSWQDLPAYFEDTLASWMGPLVRLLAYENAGLAADADDAGPGSAVDELHAAVIDVATLYQAKYDEFRPYLQTFVREAWQLLVRLGNVPRYDAVVTSGIRFLTTVARSADHALFGEAATLAQISASIIVPNVGLREEDEELFEDNPAEYIRRDMEGSDGETRRRAAVELVKGLRAHYDAPVTASFSAFVADALAAYAAGAAGAWRGKDAAIYVVTALGWKAGTAAGGATETSALVDVADFYAAHVAPELTTAAAAVAAAGGAAGGAAAAALPHPILVADALKFALTFRNQLPPPAVRPLVDAATALLGAPDVVVQSYAAATIERLLSVRDRVPVAAAAAVGATNGVGAPPAPPPGPTRSVGRVTKAEVATWLPTLLPALLSVLTATTRADASATTENVYVAKALLRTLSTAREAVPPAAVQAALSTLVRVIGVVAANPANPAFNHYVFDLHPLPAAGGGAGGGGGGGDGGAGAASATAAATGAADPPPLPPWYTALLPPLLSPALWARRSYVPGMVLYLRALARRAPAAVAAGTHLSGLLGIFQKLIASKATDHHGLALATTLVRSAPVGAMAPLLPSVVQVALTRLHHAKTAKYVDGLLLLLAAMVDVHGVRATVGAADALGAGLFAQLLGQVWVPELGTGRLPPGRRLVVATASAALLGDAAVAAAEAYAGVWGGLLQAVLGVAEGVPTTAPGAPGVTAAEEEDDDGGVAASPGAPGTGVGEEEGNSVAFSALAHASRCAAATEAVGETVPPGGAAALRRAIVEAVGRAAAAAPGVLGRVRALEPSAQAVLGRYFAEAGQTLG